MQINDYFDFNNILINNVYAMFITLKSHQEIIDNVVIIKIQFFLTLMFAITIHKCQKLMLYQIVLNFNRKNNSIEQNYITLFCVHLIENIVFDNYFFCDCFFSTLSIDTQNKLIDAIKKN